ncbi:MAG: Chaperone protein DnaJ [Syntrophorhabdus sp. PtaU1.Bin002]|nr:MAG: Chaperone protein DnaJ [Syntrophorhabdus sp. PtaB.Bin006]OPY66565.1 MAG: Chaperone protein DnaJ [Syntrophorhabdus sp. PtaU1.Bin002]
MKQKDYYRILSIEREATPQQIKEAYRKLALEYHPDRNEGDKDAVEKMKELNEAYAVLSDSEKKRHYDRLRGDYGSDAYDRFRQTYTEQDIFRGSDINQVFEEMARSFGFRHFDDVFRDFYGQGYRSFEFRRPGVFGGGFLFFRFPEGGQNQQVDPTQKNITFGLLGKFAGYLLKNALGVQGEKQERDRYDVIMLDAEEGRRGTKISYTDRVTSRRFIIAIPVGVREGQIIRLKGAAGNNGYERRAGDLYLKVRFRKGLFEKAKRFYTKLTQ